MCSPIYTVKNLQAIGQPGLMVGNNVAMPFGARGLMPSLYINVVAAFVALQHIGFLALEMFFWTKPIGLKIFRMSPEHAKISKSLAANQGLYNGFLAAGLIWGLTYSDASVSREIVAFFFVCVVVAALYGAYSVSPRILIVQGLPAAIGLLLLAL